jgi:hypothetical protein
VACCGVIRRSRLFIVLVLLTGELASDCLLFIAVPAPVLVIILKALSESAFKDYC